MAARLRPHLPATAGALLGVAVAWWLGLYGFAWSDYDLEASAAFKALAGGHVAQFLALCPSYGGSLVLRAPFAAVPGLWGGGELAVFRAQAVPCLLATAVLAVWLAAFMRRAGLPLVARVAAVGLVAANPIAVKALEFGHAEELLGSVLCVAAVLVAGRGRVTWAGVLLGLALATKAWAVLAIGPVLLALPARHWKALLVAGAVAAAVLAPLAAADGRTFAVTHGGIAETGTVFTPYEAFWFLGEKDKVYDEQGEVRPGLRLPPAWLSRVTHPLIVLLAVPLTLLALRRRRRGHAAEPMLLLALLLCERCLLDAWNNGYYCLPMLFALVAWEVVARRRPPVWSLTATAGIWLFFDHVSSAPSPDAQNVLYLALALPAAAALAAALYAPQLLARTERRSMLAPAHS